ncbi:metallophosphoesterase family protein [Pseudonocardia sp. CA-107938]|uniref:metallophosphoesterase family protein n=1 Tax=Pseudonocardia sp. CA-107938 TaxID=3240021 RepID=UPI003D8E14CD
MGLPMRFARVLDAVQRPRTAVNGAPAVQWLSVPQLVRTALEVLQASSFAKFADKREAMATSPREFYRLPDLGRPDVWVDYVADTGDGFDATFATARCVSGGAAVEVPGPARPAQADLLVLGGDEVYPTASAAQYELRLNEVFRAAASLDRVRGMPPVVALPGNHDWYDGLAAFRRNFCESWVLRTRPHLAEPHPVVTPVPPPDARDDVGGWGAFQSRSYFAIALSERWWLWAVDSQLDAPIDAEQLAYFRDATTLLGDAKIILCTASPSWLEAGDARHDMYSAESDTPLYTLLWFLDRVLGDADRHRVRLVLTGDQHHYARYTCTDGDSGDRDVEPFDPELVTCGGGGAFLASTHHLPETLEMALQPWPSGSGASARYARRTCYPDMDTSRRIGATRFLSAGWRNGPSLPLLAGAGDYLLFLAFALNWPLGWTRAWQFWVPTAIGAALLYVYATSGTKERRSRRPRDWARALLTAGHMLGHLAAAALVALLATAVLDPQTAPWYVMILALPLLVVLGTAVFVTYLQIADRFGCHTLEAFSGLRIADYKSHLRLRVSDDEIEVAVLGIESVPRARTVDDLRPVVPAVHLVETFSVPWQATRPGQ